MERLFRERKIYCSIADFDASFLTYLEMKKDGVDGVDGLNGPYAVTTSPVGSRKSILL